MDAIAKTSLLTAAMRALESRRAESEGRLFFDPYAELLAGEEGRELLETAIRVVGDQPAIAVRTAFMDYHITEAVNSGLRQIVMLAAGMDSRSYRMNFPSATKVFELDRPEVLRSKELKMQTAPLNCQRYSLPVDLQDPWKDKLLAAGFETQARTLWLVEGLVMYLNESQVLELFNKINELSKTDDLLLCDILSRNLLEAPAMQSQLTFLAGLGAPWQFGHNEPEQFLAPWGWRARAIQTGEFAPHRWPFPVAPRQIPGIPRGFLVTATRV